MENHPDGTGDVNPIVNGNWGKLNNWVNPGMGRTLRQDDGTPPGAGTVLTSSVAVFDSARDVGATIHFSDGSTATIASVSSSTVAAASASGEVGAQDFQLYQSSEDEYTALARGLMKVTKFVAGDAGKIPVFSFSSLKFTFADKPGYNVTAGQVLFGGGSAADLTSSSDLAFDDSTDQLTVTGAVVAKRFQPGQLNGTTDANDGAISFDFAQQGYISINTLQAALTMTSANRAAGRELKIRIVCDGTLRNFTFSEGWKFVGGAAPASIAANKTGELVLTCYGTGVGDVVAKWLVEP